jgi:uncharacterized membrane protein
MRRALLCLFALILLLQVVALPLAAQSTASPQSPNTGASKSAPKPPDLVCFGNGPDWSIQFTAQGARYVGMNESDRVFIGSFHWVPEMSAWSWNPTDLGQDQPLTAVIKKASCVDMVRKWTVPYSAQVNLPSGNMVSGCCRRLKPGEAPVGPGGYSPPPKQQ